jgi:hypothetical protein
VYVYFFQTANTEKPKPKTEDTFGKHYEINHHIHIHNNNNNLLRFDVIRSMYVEEEEEEG